MTRIPIVVTCAIALSACGGTSTGPTAGQATAIIQMTASPQTIAAAVCPPSHCGTLAGQLEVEATVTIRETAGVATTARRLALTLRRQSDNAAIASGEEGAGTRINASGSATVPIAMHFDATAAERNMKVVVVFEGSDANGHQITSAIEIEVRAS
jgi:hypothetical protein